MSGHANAIKDHPPTDDEKTSMVISLMKLEPEFIAQVIKAIIQTERDETLVGVLRAIKDLEFDPTARQIIARVQALRDPEYVEATGDTRVLGDL